MSSCDDADEIVKALQALDITAAAAHYRLPGDQATENFAAFTAGKIQV